MRLSFDQIPVEGLLKRNPPISYISMCFQVLEVAIAFVKIAE